MAAAPLRTPMERAPVPDLGTGPIPKERYTSAAFAGLEWQRMWTRVWLMAGRESDIPEPGDYFTFEIGQLEHAVCGGDAALDIHVDVRQAFHRPEQESNRDHVGCKRAGRHDIQAIVFRHQIDNECQTDTHS